jgi:MoxR-like ATPase
MLQVRRSLLRPLGIVGYDALEPALLAALATEDPLLLVSEHGAAKTLLLVRLANALGLELRHYNASLLQFDDLAGFPIPDERGGIRYAAPPGAIWGAEVVFIDEIGRCRPEVANKLFPIIHERRIQGVPLDRLRFRWAATNPPPEAQAAANAPFDAYEGVERLDPALADRFAYVVQLPNFADLSDADRASIVRGTELAPDDRATSSVRELVACTRALLPTVHDTHGDAASAYVLALAPRLAASHLASGGRRAATLRRNLLAVHAACLALGRPGDESAACSAMLASIPDIVRRPVPRSVLLAAHKAAWREAALPATDPARALTAVRDPQRRATLAVTLPDVPHTLRGEALCGALAEMPAFESQVMAWQLFPRIIGGDVVPATAVETIAEIIGELVARGHVVSGYGPQREWAVNARTALAQSDIPATEIDFLHGVITKAFGLPESATGLDPHTGVQGAVARVLAVRTTCIAALGVLDHAPRAATLERTP